MCVCTTRACIDIALWTLALDYKNRICQIKNKVVNYVIKKKNVFISFVILFIQLNYSDRFLCNFVLHFSRRVIFNIISEWIMKNHESAVFHSASGCEGAANYIDDYVLNPGSALTSSQPISLFRQTAFATPLCVHVRTITETHPSAEIVD